MNTLHLKLPISILFFHHLPIALTHLMIHVVTRRLAPDTASDAATTPSAGATSIWKRGRQRAVEFVDVNNATGILSLALGSTREIHRGHALVTCWGAGNLDHVPSPQAGPARLRVSAHALGLAVRKHNVALQDDENLFERLELVVGKALA